MSAEVVPMRSTPHATESIAAEKTRHRKKIEETAYVIHQRRHLMAVEDPYQAEMLRHTPAHVLAERDWLLAESIIRQGSTVALERLHQSYAELVQNAQRATIIEIFSVSIHEQQTHVA